MYAKKEVRTSQDRTLVYSTDPQKNQKCPKCKFLISECTCQSHHLIRLSSFTATLRIEKAGRGGKTVTVIDRLPREEKFLKNFARTLKTRCGSGGTYRIENGFGLVEIQGDKRDLIRSIFQKEGIQYKG
ncbi:MAG: translation initiation factor [Chlamydiae bacterium]|nr:translation initiation factor [Chlamydiota bacterium]MBI3276296.1 translation initiation factor [Chlamydiota bacterium]